MVTVGAMGSGSAGTQIANMIDLDRYVEVMGESEKMGEMDLGSTLISKVLHPVLGVVLMVNTDGGLAAMITAGSLS